MGAFGSTFRKPLGASKPIGENLGCLAIIPKGLSSESQPLRMLKGSFNES